MKISEGTRPNKRGDKILAAARHTLDHPLTSQPSVIISGNQKKDVRLMPLGTNYAHNSDQS
jgi:hypothetical protein